MSPLTVVRRVRVGSRKRPAIRAIPTVRTGTRSPRLGPYGVIRLTSRLTSSHPRAETGGTTRRLNFRSSLGPSREWQLAWRPRRRSSWPCRGPIRFVASSTDSPRKLNASCSVSHAIVAPTRSSSKNSAATAAYLARLRPRQHRVGLEMGDQPDVIAGSRVHGVVPSRPMVPPGAS
jgi:hypothetical protein